MKKYTRRDNLIYYADNTAEIAFDETQMRDAFAKSLKELREYCGLSTLKFAKEVDIAQPTISSYENKTRTPSMLQAIKISAYFRLTVEEFILCGLDNATLDIVDLYESRR